MPGYTIEYGNGLYESVWLPTREDWTPEMYNAELERIRAEFVENQKPWYIKIQEKLWKKKRKQ